MGFLHEGVRDLAKLQAEIARHYNQLQQAVAGLFPELKTLFIKSTFRPPVLTWRYAIAVTALGFLPDNALGAGFEGDLLLGGGLTGTILRFDLNADRTDLVLSDALADRVDDNADKGQLAETAGHVFASGLGIVTDIETEADGSVWVVSYSANTLFHITP
jgi:glucose/arabinose dehydrogenase